MRMIPCAISVLRALCVIPLLFLFPSHPFIAFFVFIAGALSDLLDGYLARMLNAESDLGKILDPIADKIFYLGSLMVLQESAPTLFLFILAFPFEALLTAIRFIKPYCASRAANPAPKKDTMGFRPPEHFFRSFAPPASNKEQYPRNPYGTVSFFGVGANPYGKIKTVFQFCATACMMLGVIVSVKMLIAFGLALGIMAVPLAWMSFYAHIYPKEKSVLI